MLKTYSLQFIDPIKSFCSKKVNGPKTVVNANGEEYPYAIPWPLREIGNTTTTQLADVRSHVPFNFEERFARFISTAQKNTEFFDRNYSSIIEGHKSFWSDIDAGHDVEMDRRIYFFLHVLRRNKIEKTPIEDFSRIDLLYVNYYFLDQSIACLEAIRSGVDRTESLLQNMRMMTEILNTNKLLATIDQAIEFRARKAAKGKNAEADSCKEQAIDFYIQNKSQFKSRIAAARALTKIIPFEERTIDLWLREYELDY